jgi:hypothetical protein
VRRERETEEARDGGEDDDANINYIIKSIFGCHMAHPHSLSGGINFNVN